VREHLGEHGVPAAVVAEILAEVRGAGGVERAQRRAAALADEAVAALQALPPSRYRDGLAALAYASVHRSS
jgi:octaprenyl-diphosphate synthase